MCRIGLTCVLSLAMIGIASEDAAAGWSFRCRPSRRCYVPAQRTICSPTPLASVVVQPSGVSNRPRLQITEQIIVRRRLPDGRIVEETRERTRLATTTEAINILLEQIQGVDQKVQGLDQQVFGAEQNRPVPLEQRVDALEPPMK